MSPEPCAAFVLLNPLTVWLPAQDMTKSKYSNCIIHGGRAHEFQPLAEEQLMETEFIDFYKESVVKCCFKYVKMCCVCLCCRILL